MFLEIAGAVIIAAVLEDRGKRPHTCPECDGERCNYCEFTGKVSQKDYDDWEVDESTYDCE